MTRIKRGILTQKKHRALRSRVKGFRTGRKSGVKLAKQADMKAGVYAYRDRKAKKRVFRSLWITRINAALQPLGLGYSKFVNLLKVKGIVVDRKIWAQLAHQHPKIFASAVEQIKK